MSNRDDKCRIFWNTKKNWFKILIENGTKSDKNRCSVDTHVLFAYWDGLWQMLICHLWIWYRFEWKSTSKQCQSWLISIGQQIKSLTKTTDDDAFVPLWIRSNFSRSDARFFQYFTTTECSDPKATSKKNDDYNFSFMGISLINYIANYFIIFRAAHLLRRETSTILSVSVFMDMYCNRWSVRCTIFVFYVDFFVVSSIRLTKQDINLNNNRKFPNHDWLTITFWLMIIVCTWLWMTVQEPQLCLQ